VRVEVEGGAGAVRGFAERLRAEPPPRARIDEVRETLRAPEDGVTGETQPRGA